MEQPNGNSNSQLFGVTAERPATTEPMVSSKSTLKYFNTAHISLISVVVFISYISLVYDSISKFFVLCTPLG